MKQPREFDTFTSLVDQVLAVPHSVIKERLEKERARADKNPRKRGPKRARKATDEVLVYAAGRHAVPPGPSTRELVDDVRREFGVRLHPRTLERGLARRGKRRRPRATR